MNTLRCGIRAAALASTALAAFAILPAHADDAATPPPDKTHTSLLDPMPDSALRDFSADRPGRVTNPITVDAGHLQIEGDFGNALRLDIKGATTRAFETLDPTLKLGVTSRVDIEMTLNGDELVRQRPNGTRTSMRFGDFGDVYLRAKINLLGDDGGAVALGFVPYVKIPASDGASLALGDGVVEGGGLALLQAKLPQDFVLNLQSETDALEGGADSRRHANFVHIVALSHTVPGLKALTATAEVYTSVSADRFTPDLYTADVGLAYMTGPATQLDLGANFGLNRAAPSYQVYAGISQRF